MVWIPPPILSAQCPAILRLGSCKLAVSVSEEKRLQRLGSMKPAKGGSRLSGSRCSLVIHTGMVT